jgi:predicted ABC-type ATPase
MLQKFNPNHDPGTGEFSEGDGGGGDGGSSASAFFDQHHDPTATVGGIIESVKGAASAISAAESKLQDGVATNAPVSQGGFIGPDGKYTAEREALHDSILNKLFSPEAVKAATPAQGSKPEMTLLGGRGGSGKSWFVKQGVADAAHSIYINADDLQAELPGYEGWNAALYHEEASDLTKRADRIALALGVNVIHDATMRTVGGSSKRATEYKAHGYKVNGHYMFLPPQTSTKRAIERFVRGGTEGRYVPPDYLLNSTSNERSFDALKAQLDKWTFYENTGKSPRLVSSSDKAKAAEDSRRSLRARSQSAGERRSALFEGVARKRATDDRTSQERAEAIGFRQRFNPNHDPSTGEFAEGGGEGGGGESGGSTKPAGEKPAGGKGGKAKVSKVSDFDKKGVRVDHDTTINPAKAEKFLKTWNESVGQAPEEFKHDFLGGMKGTMNIDYRESNEQMTVSGRLQDENGKDIGEYQRDLKIGDNKAYSAYFVMKSSERGGGVGKQLLAANVAMYEKMGFDKVEVSANIDVGGYAWAKYGYVPTANSWSSLSADIRDKLNADRSRNDHAASGSGYTPEEWDSIASHDQDAIESAWMASTRSEFLDSEIQNWRDSGGALDNAKADLAEHFDSGADWAKAAIATWREQRIESGKPDVPLSDEQILYAMTVSYDSDGEGRSDPGFDFDDKSLDRMTPTNQSPGQGTLPGIEPVQTHEYLTDEMRDQITDALTKEFNDHAEEQAQDADPPSYLGDNVEESQSEYWSSMDDDEKYAWADRNGELPEYPNEDDEEAHPEPVEASDPQRDALMKLAQSRDPKALWAIADSAQGKDLLLGTNWSGVLDLHDKQTMDRFHAYVGK